MGLCIISAKDLRMYRQEKNALLIDLREPEEYYRDHISGAVNVPVNQLAHFMNRIDRKRICIFYCQHGSLSFQEGKKYVRDGFQICSLAGGLDSFRKWSDR